MANTDYTKKIYLVGGYVRDKLLNKPSKDKDYVAVGYTENDFAHLKKVGKNFPVFLIDENSQIALARRETKTGIGYNGFSYDTRNVTLIEDLKRRDLTINSIALDEDTNQLIDPFNGLQDIKNKILRHTSEAFCEDPLRVLRIARFRAKLGNTWIIHNSTKKLILNMKDELNKLEKHRVYKEIEMVFKYKNSHIFFETLLELGVLEHIFPSIYKLNIKPENKQTMKHSRFKCSMMMIKKLKSDSVTLKLSALYYYINEIDGIIDIEIPKKIKDNVLLLIHNHPIIENLHNCTNEEILSLIESYKYNKDLLQDQIKLFYINHDTCFSNINKKLIEENKLYRAIEAIQYSPKQWIDLQTTPPTPTEIKQHITQKKIKKIKEIF